MEFYELRANSSNLWIEPEYDSGVQSTSKNPEIIPLQFRIDRRRFIIPQLTNIYNGLVFLERNDYN